MDICHSIILPRGRELSEVYNAYELEHANYIGGPPRARTVDLMIMSQLL